MRVYVLHSHDRIYGSWVEGVYSTKEKAQYYQNKLALELGGETSITAITIDKWPDSLPKSCEGGRPPNCS